MLVIFLLFLPLEAARDGVADGAALEITFPGVSIIFPRVVTGMSADVYSYSYREQDDGRRLDCLSAQCCDILRGQDDGLSQGDGLNDCSASFPAAAP